ncbi:MAG: hypothetical protein IBJ09_04005 [Bacteroidia bacterium]|nr:hypothetical protein [Bacteroidia bacterium]
MRKKLTGLSVLCAVLLAACTPGHYRGKYVAPEGSCIMLEYIDVKPDLTADLKYISIWEPANFYISFRGEHKDTMEISEQNRTWYFRKSNDTIYEISNNDYMCYLVKEP